MLQSEVKATQALGVAGSIANGYDSYRNTISGVCADDKVEVGYFVQRGDNEGEFKGVKGVATTAVAGVAIFDNFKDSASDTSLKNKGDTLCVLNAGSVYIETTAIAKAGQYVGVSTEDGSLMFGDTSTFTKGVFTGFQVVVGNATATRGVIVISTAGVK